MSGEGGCLRYSAGQQLRLAHQGPAIPCPCTRPPAVDLLRVPGQQPVAPVPAKHLCKVAVGPPIIRPGPAGRAGYAGLL